MSHTPDPTAHDESIAVIVNGQPKQVTRGRRLSYTDVVNLAYDDNPPTGPEVVFRVTYKDGNKQGSLVEGQDVEPKEGMVFNVSEASRS